MMGLDTWDMTNELTKPSEQVRPQGVEDELFEFTYPDCLLDEATDMDDPRLRYIELVNKRPVEKLSEGGSKYGIACDLPNLAVLIPEPFLVLDFDNPREADIVERMVIQKRMPYRIMRTDRGCHLWAKSTKPWVNRTHIKTALGLTCDIRSHGKLCYTKVKKDGVWHKWTNYLPWDEIGEIDKIFTCPERQQTIPLTTNLKEGDGRANGLFAYTPSLLAQGWEKDEITRLYNYINRFVFAEPLTQAELSHLLRNEVFDEFERKKEQRLKNLTLSSFRNKKNLQDIEREVADGVWDYEGEDRWFDKSKFLHSILAEYLMDDLIMMIKNGMIYIYDGESGYYKEDDDLLMGLIFKLAPSSTLKQRQEVMHSLRCMIGLVDGMRGVKRDSGDDKYTVNVLNGRLNLRTGVLNPHDPLYKDITQVPVEYVEGATSALLDRTINLCFEHDEELIKLFYEMVGYMLMSTLQYDKMFILVGEGKNGKSTIMNLLRGFITSRNAFFATIHDLEKPYTAGQLVGKLANFGDDLGNRPLKDSDSLKSLTSGESIMAEVKYKDPFLLQSTATLIFGCNEVPHIPDNSKGIVRRLVLLPLNHTFTEADGEAYDPAIDDKLACEEVYQALLSKAVEGAMRLVGQKGFTKVKVVEEALRDYEIVNSTALSWIDDECVTTEQIVGQETAHVYKVFKSWCLDNGVRPLTQQSFTRRICKELNLKSVSYGHGRGKCYREK